MIIWSKQTTSRNRASSAPREAISTTSSHSVTVSSAPTTVQQSQSAALVTLQKAIAPKAVLSRTLLHRFISLKSLSDSLPVLSTGVPLEATRRSAGGNDSRGTGSHNSRGVQQLPPPTQTRRSLSRPDPMKLSDLIAWKNVEIATVQNILRVNMARAMDTALCRKSRKAYRDSVQENQKTLLRLYHESEELKAARQSVLASRSFSVGRIESPLSRLSHPLHISLTLSPAQLPHPDDSLHRTQQFNGGVTTDSSGYHADEQSSDSSHSSTNQAHGASLTISCHSSGPASTFNSVPSHRKEILSPLLCSKHSSNDVRRASSDVHYQGPHETTRVTKLPTNYVQYLFPDQTRTDSATPNHIFPPSTLSPSAYFNKSPCDVKFMSELERLTSPLSRQFAPSEATPTSTTRTRFTLADKLNMSTTYFH
ncbi:unnamed protein product [Hydatigera taeniaeformis]|uniref:REM-1 domain-containing protein n=1 Tax=Hydatigena taeniaeformis TaxID=6205 RepID=A0A0R3WRZ9_HYDTA|nr:unnamed protein product [Hydatigera taeniaeformis]